MSATTNKTMVGNLEKWAGEHAKEADHVMRANASLFEADKELSEAVVGVRDANTKLATVAKKRLEK